MTPSDFYLVLAFGFVSSLHCMQMCGPIVLTYLSLIHILDKDNEIQTGTYLSV